MSGAEGIWMLEDLTCLLCSHKVPTMYDASERKRFVDVWDESSSPDGTLYRSVVSRFHFAWCTNAPYKCTEDLVERNKLSEETNFTSQFPNLKVASSDPQMRFFRRRLEGECESHLFADVRERSGIPNGGVN